MEHTFNAARERLVPCYLETTTPQAYAVHVHKGYKKINEFLIPDTTIKITTMLKDIVK